MDKHVQVLIYTSYLHIIGGIETFITSFIELMSPYYDIGVCCPTLPDEMVMRIASKAPLYRDPEGLSCDTLIMIRIMDNIPKGITYNKAVRTVHCCRSNEGWVIKDDCHDVIHVSKASKKSWESEGDVIGNPVLKKDNDCLLLVSATRIPALDKGRNADRMLKLARMLQSAEIPFLWFNFSDKPIQNAPKGMVNVGTFQDLQPYIKRADYLVQLSDQEGFGYSVAEALINNTAVIVTPYDAAYELKIKDGVNGYMIPFDMRFDVKKLLKVPKFKYEYDNKSIVDKWTKILGKTKPTHWYEPENIIEVEVIRKYDDLLFNRTMRPGERFKVFESRGQQLVNEFKFCKLVDEGDDNGEEVHDTEQKD